VKGFLYMTGPMTGQPDKNREEFNIGEERLVRAGYPVYNPARADIQVPPCAGQPQWIDYIVRDIAVLGREDCRGLAHLEGYKRSRGSRIEVAVGDLPQLRLPLRSVDHWASLDPEEALSPLLDAQRLVYGPREHAYGHPADDFGRTAQIWSAILGYPITAAQVGLCMVGVKLSRQVNRPKRDNLVDAAGYCATVQRIEDRGGEVTFG